MRGGGGAWGWQVGDIVVEKEGQREARRGLRVGTEGTVPPRHCAPQPRGVGGEVVDDGGAGRGAGVKVFGVAVVSWVL